MSIADGGKRCFSHHPHGNPSSTDALKSIKALKIKYKKTKMSFEEYQEELKVRMVEFYTTEQGIEKLESEGRFEQAEKFRGRRNKKISNYNRDTGSTLSDFPSYKERQAKLDAHHDNRGYHKKTGIHRATGTPYNEQGFNKSGIHQATGTRFDSEGYDTEDYAQDGFHKSTGLNKRGFDRDGFNPTTNLDSNGFNREGYRTSPLGVELDRNGFQRNGFNIQGIHKKTGTRWDTDGFDEEGFHGSTGQHRDSGLTRQQIWEQSRSDNNG